MSTAPLKFNMGETPQFDEEELLQKLSKEQLQEQQQDKEEEDYTQMDLNIKPSYTPQIVGERNDGFTNDLLPSDDDTEFARATDMNFELKPLDKLSNNNQVASKTKRSIKVKKKKRMQQRPTKSKSRVRSKVTAEEQKQDQGSYQEEYAN